MSHAPRPQGPSVPARLDPERRAPVVISNRARRLTESGSKWPLRFEEWLDQPVEELSPELIASYPESQERGRR